MARTASECRKERVWGEEVGVGGEGIKLEAKKKEEEGKVTVEVEVNYWRHRAG